MRLHQVKKGRQPQLWPTVTLQGTTVNSWSSSKRLKPEWLYNVTVNTLLKVWDNGWTKTDLFLEWGKQFVEILPKDDLRSYVLLLDSHTSHVFNLQGSQGTCGLLPFPHHPLSATSKQVPLQVPETSLE